MVVLGDAIAVALLERRGFSPDDFHVFHPGGKLGQQLLKVSDIMHSGVELPSVAADARMSQALIEMTQKGFGCVCVVDDEGGLAGVITDGDLRRHMADDLTLRPVCEVMTADPVTVTPDMLAGEALHVMNSLSITNLFVLDNGAPIGILHVHDCLRAGIA
jgi:arabinose-5-phosphate isomerase